MPAAKNGISMSHSGQTGEWNIASDGINDLVAKTDEGFVDIAASIGLDDAKLHDVRNRITTARSALMNDHGLVRVLEELLASLAT